MASAFFRKVIHTELHTVKGLIEYADALLPILVDNTTGAMSVECF